MGMNRLDRHRTRCQSCSSCTWWGGGWGDEHVGLLCCERGRWCDHQQVCLTDSPGSTLDSGASCLMWSVGQKSSLASIIYSTLLCCNFCKWVPKSSGIFCFLLFCRCCFVYTHTHMEALTHTHTVLRTFVRRMIDSSNDLCFLVLCMYNLTVHINYIVTCS